MHCISIQLQNVSNSNILRILCPSSSPVAPFALTYSENLKDTMHIALDMSVTINLFFQYFIFQSDNCQKRFFRCKKVNLNDRKHFLRQNFSMYNMNYFLLTTILYNQPICIGFRKVFTSAKYLLRM